MNKNKIVELLLNNGFELDHCDEDFSVERYVWRDKSSIGDNQEVCLTHKHDDFWAIDVKNHDGVTDNIITYSNGSIWLSSSHMTHSIVKLEGILSVCSIYKHFEE